MNALHALLVAAVVAAPAFAQFSWDPVTSTCRDASGQQGLNAGVRGPCADLSGAHLEGADLSRLDLRGARLDGAKLKGASLLHSDLRGASLENADLSSAVMTGARLEGASLAGARLVSAHLEHAVLTRAVLSGADVRNACLFRTGFEGADLRTARFSRTRAMLEGARWTHALVALDTLPYDAQQLAALEVQVRADVELTLR
jgi:uncharacterized protein YjbI with pentapeptide repeats